MNFKFRMKNHSEADFLKLIDEHKAIVYKIANLYAQTTEDRKDLFQEVISFRTQNNNLNVPLCLVCIIMFAGAQNILSLLPWMIAEFFLWRWLLAPKFNKRFESYIGDLRFSLNELKEIKD